MEEDGYQQGRSGSSRVEKETSKKRASFQAEVLLSSTDPMDRSLLSLHDGPAVAAQGDATAQRSLEPRRKRDNRVTLRIFEFVSASSPMKTAKGSVGGRYA